MNYGIRVSKIGKNYTSIDPEDYLIWSKYFNLKALDTNVSWPTSATILSGNYNVDYTITHNLGYTPLYNLFFLDQNNRIVRIPGKSVDTYGTRGRVLSETINSITVRLGRPSATYPTNVTYPVYHFIYVDPNSL